MRVLLIRLSSLGDVVLATAALGALHRARPEVAVDVLTKPAFRPLFRSHPGVSRVLEWEPATGLGPLARQVRTAGYAWIVDLHANLRTFLLRLAVRGPRWSVYHKGAVRRRLAVALGRSELLPGDVHVIDRYLAALAPLGVPRRRVLPRVYPRPADREEALRLLRAAGWDGAQRCVALAPGARWATKAWPPAHWRDLMGRLRARDDLLPVVVGGGEDAGLAAEVLAGGPGVNLAGHTDLLQTAAVLQLCTALVGNDSAPLHLATAVGTPVVALFGPTVQGFGFFPPAPGSRVLERNLGCRPCSLHGDPRCPRGHHRCLEELEPAAVAAAVEDLLLAATVGGAETGEER